jgi:hypothetical protein
MGQKSAVLADGEDVGGFLFARKAEGDLSFEIEQERFGSALSDRVGDPSSQESRDGLDVGNTVNVGDVLPALLQRLNPCINLLGTAAVADEKEQRAVPGKLDGVLGAKLVGELKGLDSDLIGAWFRTARYDESKATDDGEESEERESSG